MDELSLEELLHKTGNIYEAVVIMSKRARQITDEQKKILEEEMDVVTDVNARDNEDFDEVEIDREALNREYIKLPKPSRVAMTEMAKNEIEHSYRELEAGSSSES